MWNVADGMRIEGLVSFILQFVFRNTDKSFMPDVERDQALPSFIFVFACSALCLVLGGKYKEGMSMGGPLSGVRVFDFSSVVTGPFCTMLMGDLGADIIKIESADGDILRHLNITFKGGMGSWFINLNRNKRSVQFDLKRPEARETILRMVEHSDVLVQNFRPGVMERLGLDYQTVQQHNSKIVYLSISG